MDNKRFLKIAQCPVCKKSPMNLETLYNKLICGICHATYEIVDGVPRMLPKFSSDCSEDEELRKKSYQYWDGGIPGTVENGYQKGKILAEYGTVDWFIEGDKVRYNQYKNLENFCDFKNRVGQKILDIGPGRGQESFNYEKSGCFVTTLEYAGQGVQIMLDRIKASELDLDLIQGDAIALPFKDNSFDLVFSYGVLHHIPDMKKSIDEVFRVLKPGGEAKIMVYHKGYFYFKDMFFKWYILKFNFLKYKWQEYVKIAMEQRQGPCPVVYINNMTNILKMFKQFELIEYFNAEVVEGRLINWGIIPRYFVKRWMNSLGAFCHLTLRKPK